MGEQPRGGYRYIPSPLASPKSSCQMQGPHSNALPCSLLLAKQHSQTPTGSIPAVGLGRGSRKETQTQERSERGRISCLQPPSPSEGLLQHRRALQSPESAFTGQCLNREFTAPLRRETLLRDVDHNCRRAWEWRPALRAFVPVHIPFGKQLL